MIQISDELKQEIYDSAKNLWFSALFDHISGYIPEISFEDQKTLFFQLTKDALDDGLIKFDVPYIEGVPFERRVWEAPTEEIIQYLKDSFPKEATDGLDDDVNLYFYISAPPVMWRQDDGSYYGS
ncbi:hypothetical protein SAMN02745664_1042 [Moraxella cuniculi DSM 21768]|uniref:DUF596 domain-containing protein n=1 Tax=Moraxella cuniculi DSM 21768 TaxID=1122245 RepID=A0A1N7EAW7_9GAMM|nr:hypothetical protein [Moraxella cuniculi]OOS05395.1 hypothetical protein B0189_07275 [Moraxella cuniculi]SIR85148.1 hypothetical protein SAMN02745664_1042 [Moraxella cuniculi DSM 21768]